MRARLHTQRDRHNMRKMKKMPTTGVRRIKNVKVTRNRLWRKLDDKNSFFVRTTAGTQAGVLAATYGNKKGGFVAILLPSTTIEGRQRTVKVCLSGRQAKVLFDTLAKHYAYR